MGRLAGICYIKVDGDQLEVSGGVECPTTSTTKETVSGLSGPAGYKETVRTPYIKLTAIFRDDFPLETLDQNDDMTITAELANGRVYTLSGAYQVGEPAAKGDDGTVEITFEGMRGIWQ
ncbi:phage tail tube protein [uncultured Pseudacidovorax sp.]|uniref:phage tail tube protein n=1 Tax=uncultured Pseudacidovorax sp. TaxID=679313 RepID=UPI0025D803DF|nr:phage tail tube protein [uncultured Pseudacidovorax sp.]